MNILIIVLAALLVIVLVFLVIQNARISELLRSKSAPYIGEAREEIAVDYKGKDIAIGFNPDYLIDVLKNINEEMVNFEVSDAEKPGVIRIGSDYVYVVLPMQL